MLWGKKEDKSRLPDLPPYQRPAFLKEENIEEASAPMNSMQSMQNNINQEEFDALDRQGLPSFPDSIGNRGFSQTAIKDAVGGGEQKIMPYFPEGPNGKTIGSMDSRQEGFQAVEMDEWAPSQRVEDNGQMPTVNKLPVFNVNQNQNQNNRMIEPPPMQEISRELPMQRSKDIFVKLDKFYAARKSLVSIRQKLEEIDELLKRIRETKMREEQELAAWEKELLNIKSRVNDVNVNLFEKIE